MLPRSLLGTGLGVVCAPSPREERAFSFASLAAEGAAEDGSSVQPPGTRDPTASWLSPVLPCGLDFFIS